MMWSRILFTGCAVAGLYSAAAQFPSQPKTTSIANGAAVTVSYPNATIAQLTLQYSNAKGYLAFSFKSGPCGSVHDGSDVLLAWFNSAGTGSVLDGFISGFAGITADSQQDYLVSGISSDGNGNGKVTVLRKLNTGDQNDFVISPGKTYCLGWANDGKQSNGAPLSTKHDNRGKQSSSDVFTVVPGASAPAPAPSQSTQPAGGTYPSKPQLTDFGNGNTLNAVFLNTTHAQLTLNYNNPGGYFAISFSQGNCNNGVHGSNSDVLMVWFNSAGQGTVLDGQINGFAVRPDGQQDYQVIAISSSKLTVVRALNTQTARDVPITPGGSYCIGWALDKTAGNSAPVSVKHDSRGKVATAHAFDLVAGGSQPTPTASVTNFGNNVGAMTVSFPDSKNFNLDLVLNNAAGYLAVSYQPGQCGTVHSGSDVLFAYFDSAGNGKVVDGTTTSHSGVQTDTKNDYLVRSVSTTGSTSKISVTRALNTGDNRDFIITPGSSLCIGFATSKTVSTTPLTTYHDNRGSVTSTTAFGVAAVM